MRQNHAAGDKLFVDYSGDTTTAVVDRLTGKTRRAHLFMAVLGASSLSYAEAHWSEPLGDGSAAMSMRWRHSAARRRGMA
jgi:transposase